MLQATITEGLQLGRRMLLFVAGLDQFHFTPTTPHITKS